MPIEQTKMAVANSDGTLTFVCTRMMCSVFQKWHGSLVFVLATSLCVLLIQSAHVHVRSAENKLDLNLSCLTACNGDVMIASQQPSDCDFL